MRRRHLGKPKNEKRQPNSPKPHNFGVTETNGLTKSQHQDRTHARTDTQRQTHQAQDTADTQTADTHTSESQPRPKRHTTDRDPQPIATPTPHSRPRAVYLYIFTPSFGAFGGNYVRAISLPAWTLSDHLILFRVCSQEGHEVQISGLAPHARARARPRAKKHDHPTRQPAPCRHHRLGAPHAPGQLSECGPACAGPACISHCHPSRIHSNGQCRKLGLGAAIGG